MKSRMNIQPKFWAVAVLALTMALAACGGDSSTTESGGNSGPNIPAYGPNIEMVMPDTLTGGSGVSPASAPYPGGLIPMARGFTGGGPNQPMHGDGNHCNFIGHGNGDPFKNGHSMTKFLVGAIASWSCIANHIIGFVDILKFYDVPADGIPFDITDNNSQPEDPTYVSIEEVSAVLTEVKLYWTAGGGTPPAPGNTDVGFYLAWDSTGGNTDGRLIVDISSLADAGDPHDPAEDPTFLRLDFNKIPGTTQTGDMYIGFDSTPGTGHPWAQGWHINVVKRLDGTTPKYTAMGVIDMTEQWDLNYNYGGTPQLNSFAVADTVGMGAAVAQMAGLGLSFTPIDDGDHLGSFKFTKDDRYYFGGGPQVIFKAFTAVEYMGDRSLGGTGITTPAQVDNIFNENGLNLYTGTLYDNCTTTPLGPTQDCEDFFNALFSEDQFGAEKNIGDESSIVDGRKEALDAGLFLLYANSCPDEIGGCVWDTTDVFAMSYP